MRLVLLVCASGAAALRVSVTRRAAIGAAFTALPAFAGTCEDVAGEASWIEGKQRQGMGKFVAGFDAAVASRDPAAVKSALEVLKLPSDAAAVATALDHKGSAAGHAPVLVGDITTGLASAKVSVRVENACMTPNNYVRFLYMKEKDTGKVLGVRELTKLDPKRGGPEYPEMIKTTVPKGTTIVPCAYSVPFGLWEGEPFQT